MTDHSVEETILWCHPTAIIAIDGSRRVCYANRAARHLLAIGDESVEGRDVVQLFGNDESFARVIDSTRDEGEERRFKLAFRRGERKLNLGLTLSPYFEQAAPLTMVLSCRDIKEHQLLNDRDAQLEQLASAERLVGGFAHQLRNPLAAISALIENLVAETPSSDPRTEYTSRLVKQVERMERLIRACLEFGLDSPVVRRRSTAEVIGLAAINAFETRHGVAPRLVVEAGTRDVFVSEDQIIKCLGLLLESALDACGEVSKMELLVAPEFVGGIDRFVRFIVRDEGPGLEKSDLAMLFEPFYTTKARGVGIGLAAAQALAVHNGGALEVRSRPDETQFILRLRAAESPEAGSRLTSPSVPPSVRFQ